jgi:uncharacterized membrane protein YkvI
MAASRHARRGHKIRHYLVAVLLALGAGLASEDELQEYAAALGMFKAPF